MKATQELTWIVVPFVKCTPSRRNAPPKWEFAPPRRFYQYISPNTIKDAVDDTIHCAFYLYIGIGTRKIQSQYAGGILLTPVQTLVTTLIFAPHGAKMQTSPFRCTADQRAAAIPRTASLTDPFTQGTFGCSSNMRSYGVHIRRNNPF